MISDYVLNELHKLFPEAKISVTFSENEMHIKAADNKYLELLNNYLFDYNAGTKKLQLNTNIKLDKLQELLSILSIVRNVKLEEVKEDE